MQPAILELSLLKFGTITLPLFQVLFFTIESLHTVCVFTGHYSLVRCLRMKDDIVVSCSEDRTIRVWNIKQKDPQLTIYGHHLFIYEIDFDSESVFSATDGAVREYDIKTGTAALSNNN